MITININWNELKSIKNAERKKAQLENRGFILISENMTGINTSQFKYEVTR